MTVRYSNEAEEDLIAIFMFSRDEWGPVQAEHYLDGLSDTITLLERMPSMGRNCSSFQLGMQRFEKGRHVVFYMTNAEELLVVRILHDRELPTSRHFS